MFERGGKYEDRNWYFCRVLLFLFSFHLFIYWPNNECERIKFKHPYHCLIASFSENEVFSNDHRLFSSFFFSQFSNVNLINCILTNRNLDSEKIYSHFSISYDVKWKSSVHCERINNNLAWYCDCNVNFTRKISFC